MTVEYTPESLKDLKKLDRHISRQILACMDDVAKTPLKAICLNTGDTGAESAAL